MHRSARFNTIDLHLELRDVDMELAMPMPTASNFPGSHSAVTYCCGPKPVAAPVRRRTQPRNSHGFPTRTTFARYVSR